jgi:hypothetical protein
LEGAVKIMSVVIPTPRVGPVFSANCTAATPPLDVVIVTVGNTTGVGPLNKVRVTFG